MTKEQVELELQQLQRNLSVLGDMPGVVKLCYAWLQTGDDPRSQQQIEVTGLTMREIWERYCPQQLLLAYAIGRTDSQAWSP